MEIPDNGLFCDLVWSDPQFDLEGWDDNERGVSFVFGEDVLKKFLDNNELDLVVRAH